LDGTYSCSDHLLELERLAMTAFPSVVYDLGNIKGKLPALHRPIIDQAISELMRMSRECATLEAALRLERTPRHISQIEGSM
jgi:hypothetical protein